MDVDMNVGFGFFPMACFNEGVNAELEEFRKNEKLILKNEFLEVYIRPDKLEEDINKLVIFIKWDGEARERINILYDLRFEI